MNLKLNKPLVFFDLETTGVNITADRIVEYAFVKQNPDGSTEKLVSRINPEIPIPVETSLIHGIYSKDVKDAPTFKEVSKDLARFLEGCDLGGFNIVRFDVPLLMEEFNRVGIDFDITKRNLIDAQKIFHMMEKRNLSAAFKFYCGKTLEDAHSAEADTIATLEVFKAQVEKYEGEEAFDMKGNLLGTIQNDMKVIDRISSSNQVDLAGRMVYSEEGVPLINFGKHKGKPVEEVLKREPAYYDWVMRGDFPQDTKRRLTQIKLNMLKR
ncbi:MULTISPECIES: 3'-5' exonuclease [Persicobacter]|uniref:DNA polymerase III subunit epsilon n=1 Tax=Persicobacter diffluens TaxID=981 RepID=A0AAN4VYT7_9BACT|nr:3'-5' exonuclease [Persicobacter sp. CCB-QB2]GJM61443.1 DNA polymerase III subunit epsilon [Persicobacter diffluens]